MNSSKTPMQDLKEQFQNAHRRHEETVTNAYRRREGTVLKRV